MAHKSRAEQKALRVRKDPNKLARQTKRHSPKTAYKRVRVDVKEVSNELAY